MIDGGPRATATAIGLGEGGGRGKAQRHPQVVGQSHPTPKRTARPAARATGSTIATPGRRTQPPPAAAAAAAAAPEQFFLKKSFRTKNIPRGFSTGWMMLCGAGERSAAAAGRSPRRCPLLLRSHRFMHVYRTWPSG